MTNFVLLRSTVVFSFLLVESEAIDVDADAVDEIVASTSLACSHTRMHRLSKEGRRIGKVMMIMVGNKHRNQNP